MTFEPLDKKRAAHLIGEKILEAIENNVYKPGDQLPSERIMAKSFQVARNVVREAISTLEAIGIIEVIQGKGVYLKSINIGPLIEKFKNLISDNNQLLEMLELRRGFEREIVILAVERALEEDLQKIELAYKEMEVKMLLNEVAFEEDYNFHKCIAVAAHNKLILKVFQFLFDQYHIGFEAARKKSINNPKENKWILDSHKKLFQAIKQRNKEEAIKVFEEHLEHVYQKLKTN